ncbi:MAG: (4Fe-4S)-binding protein [Nitrospiraceae bacterium]|nr:(4Fe-4S)-binding protein [Nitrospiraceae bacterium]
MTVELVVISGKGGTGKTSLVASLAALAEDVVLADCDVDAADLHLILSPAIRERGDFSGGSVARVNPEACYACGRCIEVCRFEAISPQGPPNSIVESTYTVDPVACEGCGVCERFCPGNAIEFGPVVNGEWFTSDTRMGPMAHAKLGIAEDNSGKLVTLVRDNAKRLAKAHNLPLIIIDGSPGIGCPVIASITGADWVLVVTEPTLCGAHDLERVLTLTRHFKLSTALCVNKWDLNPAMAEEIESKARAAGAKVLGRVSYDRAVTLAQVNRKAVVECGESRIASEIKEVWENLCKSIQ